MINSNRGIGIEFIRKGQFSETAITSEMGEAFDELLGLMNDGLSAFSKFDKKSKSEIKAFEKVMEVLCDLVEQGHAPLWDALFYLNVKGRDPADQLLSGMKKTHIGDKSSNSNFDDFEEESAVPMVEEESLSDLMGSSFSFGDK